MSLRDRLNVLEIKIDAALILLKLATSHDDFCFTEWKVKDDRTYVDVSEHFIRKIEWARKVASRVPLPEDWFQSGSGRLVLTVPRELCLDTPTSGTAGTGGTSPKSGGRGRKEKAKKYSPRQLSRRSRKGARP